MIFWNELKFKLEKNIKNFQKFQEKTNNHLLTYTDLIVLSVTWKMDPCENSDKLIKNLID